ncbi:hypothetical protein ACJMK2_037724, partial [Sinanodonta woodiana]
MRKVHVVMLFNTAILGMAPRWLSAIAVIHAPALKAIKFLRKEKKNLHTGVCELVQ